MLEVHFPPLLHSPQSLLSSNETLYHDTHEAQIQLLILETHRWISYLLWSNVPPNSRLMSETNDTSLLDHTRENQDNIDASSQR